MSKYNTTEIFNTYSNLKSYSATAKKLGIDYRTVKRHVEKFHEDDSFVSGEAHRTGIPFDRISHYWLKTKNEVGDDVSIFVKNKGDSIEYEELKRRLIEDLNEYSPKVNRLDYKEIDDRDERHMLVIDPADIHIGKLSMISETGYEYNIEIAKHRVLTGIQDLLRKARGFPIESIVFVIGNDVLHYDSSDRKTTGGTPQDSEGQWWSIFQEAKRLYIEVIDWLKAYAPVTLVYNPSNHDEKLGFTLADSLLSWYRNDENVMVDDHSVSMHDRKYIQYGVNLLGFTHGHGAKLKDLTSLMQFEARSSWANTKYSYWYVHHFHHKFRLINNVQIEKEHNGVSIIDSFPGIAAEMNTSVECVRSPSSPDAWHSKKGYVNLMAIEAFIHSYDSGQVARLTSHC